MAVSAVQMLGAYNVIANDGVYVAPKLLRSTDSGRGQVPTEPSATHRVVSKDTAAAMQAMLAKVVSDGTGELAAVSLIYLADDAPSWAEECIEAGPVLRHHEHAARHLVGEHRAHARQHRVDTGGQRRPAAE